MTYLSYWVPQTAATLIGSEKGQIARTLEYYNDQRGTHLVMPKDDQIEAIDTIEIYCALPMSVQRHVIRPKISDDVSIELNANAYDFVAEQFCDGYAPLKRGALYKFMPNNLGNVVFLPENVIEAMAEYDWSQHRAEVETMRAQRSIILNRIEDASPNFLQRVRKTGERTYNRLFGSK